MKEAEELRVGVRKGMMWFGRERLAESAYENAVAEMKKPQPNRQSGAVAPELRDQPQPEIPRSDRAERKDHRQTGNGRGQLGDPRVCTPTDHGRDGNPDGAHGPPTICRAMTSNRRPRPPPPQAPPDRRLPSQRPGCPSPPRRPGRRRPRPRGHRLPAMAELLPSRSRPFHRAR